LSDESNQMCYPRAGGTWKEGRQVVGRGELTEEAWRVIAPLLPRSRGHRGGQWRDHRTVINGILWKLRTGAPWRDLPERYGPWQTCADRLYRWRRDGTWDRMLAHVQTKSDAVGEIVWEVSIDSTTARAHQHASGARRRPSQADAKRGFSTQRTRGSGAAVAG
jgi:transposase